MITVTLLLPSVLRADAGGTAQLRFTLAEPASLADLLDALGAQYPRAERRIRDERGQLRRYVNLFVDGDECRTVGGAAAELVDGAEVQVVPSVAGG